MRYREFHYRWEWRLQSTPEQLWPLVTNTNRFNRDTGLPAVQPAGGDSDGNTRRHLRLSQMGIGIEWEEEPFQWVRPHRYGVVRRYRGGPIALLRVQVELTAQPGGGCHLLFQAWFQPRNPLGLVVIPLFMARNRRAFDKAYRTYDREAAKTSSALEQPSKARFAPGGRARLAMVQRSLDEQRAEPDLAKRLVETVEKGDGLSVARLRPYVLADEWGVPRRKVLELCLRATRAGLFDLQWDILCPLCRGASESSATLTGVKQQVHCEGCLIDYSVNFDRTVELTFRPNRAIRLVETRNFCVGGPQVTPHIVAQQLVQPGNQRDVTLPLEPGRYRLRTLGLDGGRFLVAAPEGVAEATLAAQDGGWPPNELSISLAPTLHFSNDTTAEQLFILERMAWTDQAVTAAEVTSLQVFRDLFSNEVLRPGEEISVGTLTVLFTDLRDSTRLYRAIGDAPAFGRVMDHFSVLREAIASEDGAVVKTIGDAVMAVFLRPVAALRATLSAQRRLASPAADQLPLYLKVGMHRGACIAVTLNDRLDYFGSAVNMAARLARLSSGSDVIISAAVRNDPEVAELLSEPTNGVAAEGFDAPLKGFDDERFTLWRVKGSQQGDLL